MHGGGRNTVSDTVSGQCLGRTRSAPRAEAAPEAVAHREQCSKQWSGDKEQVATTCTPVCINYLFAVVHHVERHEHVAAAVSVPHHLAVDDHAGGERLRGRRL